MQPLTVTPCTVAIVQRVRDLHVLHVLDGGESSLLDLSQEGSQLRQLLLQSVPLFNKLLYES